MDSLISHEFVGATPATRYNVVGLSSDEAHRMIGANMMAGFEPVVHTRTAKGEQLRTRDGSILTVVALHGTGVMSVLGFEQV